MSGNRFEGALPGIGDHKVRVYPMRRAYLSRDEAALYDRFPDSDCDDWPELAAGHHANTAHAWQLADALYPEPEPGDDSAQAAPPRIEDAWGLRLAAEVLAEGLPQEKLKRRNARTRERVRPDPPGLLAGSALPAAEWVTGGLHLAQLDDPRPGAVARDAMAFCRVPAGRFFLGAPDDEGYVDAETGGGPHRLDYGYWIARWPLTVAQRRAYVEAAGRDPEDPRSLRGPANTPVVYFYWREAMRCADWLT